MAEEPNRHFFKEDIQMPNITNHQGNAYRNHDGIPLLNGYYPEEITSVDENVEKRELLCTVGNVHWFGLVENSMGVPQKEKLEIPYDPQFHFWVFIQRKLKH